MDERYYSDAKNLSEFNEAMQRVKKHFEDCNTYLSKFGITPEQRVYYIRKYATEVALEEGAALIRRCWVVGEQECPGKNFLGLKKMLAMDKIKHRMLPALSSEEVLCFLQQIYDGEMFLWVSYKKTQVEIDAKEIALQRAIVQLDKKRAQENLNYALANARDWSWRLAGLLGRTSIVDVKDPLGYLDIFSRLVSKRLVQSRQSLKGLHLDDWISNNFDELVDSVRIEDIAAPITDLERLSSQIDSALQGGETAIASLSRRMQKSYGVQTETVSLLEQRDAFLKLFFAAHSDIPTLVRNGIDRELSIELQGVIREKIFAVYDCAYLQALRADYSEATGGDTTYIFSDWGLLQYYRKKAEEALEHKLKRYALKEILKYLDMHKADTPELLARIEERLRKKK